MTGNTPRVTASSRSPAKATSAQADGRTALRRLAARSDLLLALTALPAQDPATYVHAMAETITRALDVDRTAVLRYVPSRDSLITLGVSGTLQAGESDDLDCLPLDEPSSL